MRLFCWFWFWFSSLGHNNFHPYGFNGCPSISFSLFPFIAYFLRCCCSIAKSCPTLCNCMDHSTPGSSVLHYLPELARIHVHWVPCYLSISSSVTPFTFCLQSFPASGSFPIESALPIRWPKYWSFSFSISPSNEYSGLISFRMDWLDLLAVQGTLKILLQNHNSKASILQNSAFFMVQLSHLYMTTGKTVTLTIWILSIKWHLCFLTYCLDLS